MPRHLKGNLAMKFHDVNYQRGQLMGFCLWRFTSHC